jgi:magnesium transporter
VDSAACGGERRVADVRLNDSGEVLPQPDRFVWIGLHEPDEGLLREVQQEFELHDLVVEDARAAPGAPRWSSRGGAFFTVLRTAG